MNQQLRPHASLASVVLHRMRLQLEIRRLWIMDFASHSPTGSARQPNPSAAQPDCLPIPCDKETSEMSSAGQAREECEQENQRSSRALSADCAHLIHELANTTTAVLVNVQVLGWKLPAYSRLKRPLHEIERNAQRGGELMKRLLSQLSTDSPDPASYQQISRSHTVTAQEPEACSGSAANLPLPINPRPAPVFSCDQEDELTAPCDGCTSTFPKKG